MMEQWNDGFKANKLLSFFPNIPLFQYSIIPLLSGVSDGQN